MLYVEQKYAMLVGMRLDQFKVQKQNPFLANFRCPLCGDSKKNPRARRGYFYERESRINFHCHNCNESSSLQNFIKQVDGSLYADFRRENFVANNSMTVGSAAKATADDEIARQFATKVEFSNRDWHELLAPIEDLEPTHTARRFVERRRIPREWWTHLWYADQFKHWANTIAPAKFDRDSLRRDEPRLVIAFLGPKRQLIAAQGRSLDVAPDKGVKYITITADERFPHVFGLDRYDNSKRGYATEGPFDSMFLPNAVAAAGGSIHSALPSVGVMPQNTTIIPDNEPRNIHVVRGIERALERGFDVFFWPPGRPKDLNDTVLAGENDLVGLIESNTQGGVKGMLKLARWRKC